MEVDMDPRPNVYSPRPEDTKNTQGASPLPCDVCWMEGRQNYGLEPTNPSRLSKPFCDKAR